MLRGSWKVGQGEARRKAGLSTGQAREGLAAHALCPHLQGPCKHPRAWPFGAQDEHMRGDLRPALRAGPAAGQGTPVFWEAAGACDFPRVLAGACQSLCDGGRPALSQSPSKHSSEDHRV